MIGFLSGIVHDVTANKAIVVVHDVGYRVSVPATLGLLVGQPVSLFIHTHVKEDDISLYGFTDQQSLNLFETLISISGIGPKIGLTLLSAATPSNIKQAIDSDNVSFFTSIPGIGKKGAQKIIIEAKSKISRQDTDLSSLNQTDDLSQALLSLGFLSSEFQPILTQVDRTQPLSTQIRQVLKQLNRK